MRRALLAMVLFAVLIAGAADGAEVGRDCPSENFNARVYASVVETYQRYDYVRDPYPWCYWCCCRCAGTYAGRTFYKKHHPGGDGDCGCGGDMIDHTSQWYCWYQGDLGTGEDTWSRTCDHEGTVNGLDHPCPHGLDLGPACVPPIEPRHNVYNDKNWPTEQSLNLSCTLTVMWDNPSVDVFFSNPWGSTTTTDPTAYLIACTAPCPLCEVDPTNLAFNVDTVGEVQSTTFTIHNNGGGGLAGEISESCPEFTVEPSSYDLGAWESEIFTVTYTPEDCGNDVCVIETGVECANVTCNAAGPDTPECAIDPTELDFEADSVGDTDTHAFIITNIACGQLAGQIKWNCQDFTVDPTLYSLGPDESETFRVVYAPQDCGDDVCVIETGPLCSDVTCNAVGPKTPNCGVKPTDLSFGVDTIGNTDTQTFTIANPGCGTLAGEITWNCPEFTVDPTQYSLGHNESETFDVVYAPMDCGDDACTIETGPLCPNVICNAAGPILPICKLSPADLNFTADDFGDTDTQTFSITNPGCGTLAGEITWDCQGFTVDPTQYSLGHDESEIFSVVYAPEDCGDDVCEIDTDTGCGPVTCTATGPHVPECEVEPGVLRFRVEGIGATKSLTFTITNRRCGMLDGEIIESCDEFEVDPTTYTLGPNQSQVFTVTFTSERFGARVCILDPGADCDQVRCVGICHRVQYVANGGDNWGGDGSQEHPFRTIQYGLNQSQPGDIVEAAPGIYREHAIRLKSGVVLRGGQPRQDEVVVDAEGRGYAFEARSVEDAVLENLTITGGSWSGVYVYGSSITMRDCRLKNNWIRTTGGGGLTCQLGSATLEDCVFTGNHTDAYGGAIYAYKSTLGLNRCTFVGNTAERDGGAVYFKKSTVGVHACHFRENSGDDGGGIYSAYSTLNLGGSVFWANSAGLGGGLYAAWTPLTLSSCTFAANRATFAAALNVRTEGATQISNCIFGFNGPGPWFRFTSGDPAFYCCDVFGNVQGDWVGSLSGQGGQDCNHCTDPCFCDLDAGDCHLATGSPCADDALCGPIGALGVDCSGPMLVVPGTSPQAVGSGESVERFHLGPAVPNPFKPVTEISYRIPEMSGRSRVILAVYNTLGRRVRTLVDDPQASGIHSVVWEGKDDNGADVASGVYFYRITWSGRTETRRMVLLK